MSNNKNDIFQILNNLNKKNKEFYSQLTEDQQKALQPLVVMRWLTGTTNPAQVFFINELVNTKVFSLHKHKQLLVDLMTICTPGKPQKYNWLKKQNKSSNKLPNSTQVIQQYFGYNSKQANQSLPLLDNEDIMDYAKQLGWQGDQIKSLRSELKTRT